MKQYHRIMEIFWLVTTIITVFLAVYIVSKSGIEEGGLMLTLPVIAFVLFMMRRYARKKHEDDGFKR